MSREKNEYSCPNCGAEVVVFGFYADTFGDEVTCSACDALCEVEHECGWGFEGEDCSTFLTLKRAPTASDSKAA